MISKELAEAIRSVVEQMKHERYYRMYLDMLSEDSAGVNRDGDDDGEWITVNGARVHLNENGEADKGPSAVKQEINKGSSSKGKKGGSSGEKKNGSGKGSGNGSSKGGGSSKSSKESSFTSVEDAIKAFSSEKSVDASRLKNLSRSEIGKALDDAPEGSEIKGVVNKIGPYKGVELIIRKRGGYVQNYHARGPIEKTRDSWWEWGADKDDWIDSKLSDIFSGKSQYYELKK